MKREVCDLLIISISIAIGLSLYVGQMNAAVTLPPEDKPLIRHYYKKHNTCANVEPFVKHQVKLAWDKDKTITAKLLKLLYADCMVNGCDASILLDGPNTERNAPQSSWLGGFDVINRIKTVLEIRCPRAVSCADILNLAVRDAVHMAGAPSYPVFLGRRDGLESKASWIDLPPPSISADEGLDYFKSKGLDDQDYATLLGAHNLGKAHCVYIRDRIYNFNNTKKPDPLMSKSLLAKLRKQCPETLKYGQNDSTVFLTDRGGDKYRFGNHYYKNILSHNSVLRVDQELLYNDNTTQVVLEFVAYFEQFRRRFALSINRMGGLKVLTGTQGEIRLNCSFTNRDNPKLRV